MTQPLISIIALNYNQLKVTCEFLESTKQLKYSNYEIIVVDNHSLENPEAYIKQHYPEVTVVRNEKNLGFSGGNNSGIKIAKGDYYFVVNNDTEVTPDLLDHLLEPFLADESIGIVCPKIMYFDKPDLIQYAGYTKINSFTGRNKAIGQKEKDQGQHDTPGYTNYAHGAAMLVKKEVVDKVGMLPDEFFLYYEELDWSNRAVKAGFKVFYNPKGVIFHKESISVGKESPLKAYYHNRNRVLFMKRANNMAQFSIFMLFFVFVVTPKQTLKYTVHSQWAHLRNYYKALFWNIKNL
ncbi:glycosyltransferase family 2 protein [Fulvivirga sediminis]|uniref:Glycosyltransferase family 2 protein n=1 Tax=Fulvivirga sediminis TaxID=2803949 RepID=A0A937FC66_9BACT|nr:glycosyltransferase family 2 protein [Fulvivirga sediminis]MBL3658200.1 glycosyltransferase family 2 protein [Fulvivirga sediminis]